MLIWREAAGLYDIFNWLNLFRYLISAPIANIFMFQFYCDVGGFFTKKIFMLCQLNFINSRIFVTIKFLKQWDLSFKKDERNIVSMADIICKCETCVSATVECSRLINYQESASTYCHYAILVWYYGNWYSYILRILSVSYFLRNPIGLITECICSYSDIYRKSA